jgi:hypothetical protein
MPFEGVLDVLQPEPPGAHGRIGDDVVLTHIVLVEPEETKEPGNPNDWTLHRDLIYRAHDEVIVVKATSTTDFASTPQPLQWLIPKTGRYTKPAVMHDFLWRTGSMPRSHADRLFRHALEEGPHPVSFCKRWVMWAGVRWTSLLKSGFRDGWRDIPRLLLVTLSPPGLIALLGGLAMSLLLLVFFAFEVVVLGAHMLLRRTSRFFRARTAPAGKPSLDWKR